MPKRPFKAKPLKAVRDFPPPPHEIDDVLAFCEQLISEAVDGRRLSQVLDRVARFDQYFWGSHRIKLRDSRKGNSVRNKFAEIIENRVAQLTDSPPKWFFRSQEEGDNLTSDMLNQFLGDYVFDKIEWEDEHEQAILNAGAAGSCFIKTLVNAEDGYADFVIMPPESFAPDPHAKTKRKLRYWIHFNVRPLDEVKEEYDAQLAGERISADDDFPGSFTSPELSYKATAANTAPSEIWHQLRGGLNNSEDAPDSLKRAVVVEVWFQDLSSEPTPFSMDEVDAEHSSIARGRLPAVTPEMNHEKHIKAHEEKIRELSDDPANNQLIEAIALHIRRHARFDPNPRRARYPRGRVVTLSQGMILSDRPNPLPMDFRDVLIKWDWNKMRNSFYGKPAGHDLYDMQDDLNHRSNSITMNINMLNNGIRTFKKSIYKNFARISNIIGLNVPVNEHDDFKATFGPALPPHVVNDYFVIENQMEKQSGNNEIQQGRLPAPGTAGVTVAQLDEKGSVRMRKVMRNYAYAMKQMARNSIAIMAEFADPQELIRVIGDQNTAQTFRWGDIKDEMGRKDIRVDTISMDSTTRTARLQEAIALKREDIYDDEAVLAYIDDPQKYAVLQRKSILLQMANALEASQIQNEQFRKMINSQQNAAQNSEKDGNVGIFPTN